MSLGDVDQCQKRLLTRNFTQQAKQAIPRILRVVAQSWRIDARSGTVDVFFAPDMLVHQHVE